MISVFPVLISVGFLALAAVNIASVARGTGGQTNISADVIIAIGTLLVTVVLLQVMPIFFDGLSQAYNVGAGGRYMVYGNFGSIVNLVFQFIPVVIPAAMLALIGYSGYRTYGRYRAGELF